MGTLIKPTTVMFKRASGATTLLTFAKRRSSGSWVDITNIVRRNGGSWLMRYSTPDAAVGGGGAASNSGGNSAGSVAVQCYGGCSGTNSGSISYSWAYQSGDTGYYLRDGQGQNPVLQRDFSGVANGTSSSSSVAFWRLTTTDNQTGAQSYADLTIGPFTWTNTIPAEDAISVTAADASGRSEGFGGFTATPTASTAGLITAAGGSGSYPTWRHDYVSGDSGIACSNQNIQSPNFSKTMSVGPLGDSSTSAVWRVTVTDSEGHQASATYNVSLEIQSTND